MGDPHPKLEAHAVTRTFGRGTKAVHALGPVDLKIAPGEFTCVVGPSGCGKSTLLRIAAGLLRPSRGELTIRTAAQRPAAMIFQDYGIYDWKTVQANVRFGLDIQKVPRREANTRATDWLTRMGLADFADAYPAALSGGMRQRVAIARALAHAAG
uniref:ABC transporter ATP-binding protein n=1 Tax=Streptomyces kanamyceticus TaxID=1967 RepID=UPI000AB52BE1